MILYGQFERPRPDAPLREIAEAARRSNNFCATCRCAMWSF